LSPRAAPFEVVGEALDPLPLTAGEPLGVVLAEGALVSEPLVVPFWLGVVAAPPVSGLGTVALVCSAAAWKAANVFSGVALIENTIPFWQWVAWRQKNQSGEVSVKEKDQVGNSVALAATGMKPDEIPTMLGVTEVLVSWVQGSTKDDWVEVWFLDVKTKVMMSPEEAVMLFGW